MLKLLRLFLKWADKRFPERVVITQSAYEDLIRMTSQNTLTTAELSAKIVKLEFEVNKFNVAMGFGTRGTGMVGLER